MKRVLLLVVPHTWRGAGSDAFLRFEERLGHTLWFCTFERSVYRTTDRGMTWSVARNVLGSDGVGLVVAFKDSMNGLACSPFNNTGGNRIHRTTDGGATWTSLPPSSIPATPTAIWLAYDPALRVYVMTSQYGTTIRSHPSDSRRELWMISSLSKTIPTRSTQQQLFPSISRYPHMFH
jgi:hypothetical protein